MCINSSVLRQISYGMYVIGTKVDGRNVGCFVNTVVQVTSDEPMLTVCINKKNFTNEAIKKTKNFSVSILSEKTNPLVIGTFGFFSSKDKNKFEEVGYEEIQFAQDVNLPVLKDNICGVILCELVDVIDAETHDIFLARVIETKMGKENLVPMTYRYYHEVIKGTAPKTAPTYSEESEITETEGKINENIIDENEKGESKMENQEPKKYQCTICGYIYDDSKEEIKFEDLPDDWKCPKCKVGKNLFKEI